MFFTRKNIPLVAISDNFKWGAIFDKKIGELES